MKMFLISDNIDTLTGMRLAGIEGIVVHERDEFIKAVDTAVGNSQIGVLLVTEKLAENFRSDIDEVKISHSLPIMVEVPDRHGTVRGPDSITAYVREAIGVKI